LTVNNPVRLDPNADPETSRSQIDRARSRLHQSEPVRAGLPAGLTPSDYRWQRWKKGM